MNQAKNTTSRSKMTGTNSSNSLTHLLVEQSNVNKPIGIRLFGICFKFKSQASKRAYHQALVLLLTFIAYTGFHMSRRPLSVVKNVLNRDCSRVKPKNITNLVLDEASSIIFLNQVPTLQQQNTLSSDDSVSLPDLGTTTQAPTISSDNNYDYDNEQAITTTTTLAPFLARQAPKIDNTQINDQRQQQQQLIKTTNTIRPRGLLQVKDTSCDWAPFNDDTTANKLLAALDSSFLLSYAIFMFFSGFIAERTNLRYFISLGSLASGLGLIAFGVSYSLDIHSMAYFIGVQVFSGMAQTTGWPVVVTCVSNWFDRSKLGTIYGLWNSHTNLGNILGATIAGYYVESDWGLSFIVPGLIMIALAILLFLFLVPTPQDVKLPPVVQPTDGLESSTFANEQENNNNNNTSGGINQSTPTTNLVGSDLESAIVSSQNELDQYGSTTGQAGSIGPKSDDSSSTSTTLTTDSAANLSKHHHADKPISFIRALQIPGVLEFSFCLFFSKLVSYTFLYWLPRYITHSTSLNSQDSAYLSTPFDIGGIAGSVLAGWLSDRFKVNGIICNIMLILAIPSMYIYQQFGSLSSWHNILLQLLVGSLVNGPYCLITTAVSADLGNRIKDGHAMATVSAIIDGMGSIGAVLGPLFAGFVSSNDWRSVFLMLMMADVFASLCIVRVTLQDIRSMTTARRQQQQVATQQQLALPNNNN